MSTSSVNVYIGQYGTIVFGRSNFDLKWNNKQVPLDTIKRAFRLSKWDAPEARYNYIDAWMAFKEDN